VQPFLTPGAIAASSPPTEGAESPRGRPFGYGYAPDGGGRPVHFGPGASGDAAVSPVLSEDGEG
jgi:hypothetical protein